MQKRVAAVVLGAGLGLAGSLWAAPPTVPAGLRGDTSVPGQVTLSWETSPGAVSYNVYRSVDPFLRFRAFPFPPTWEFVGGVQPVVTNVSSPSHTDSGLPPLVRQFYAVTAVNDEGESPLSGFLPPFIEVRVTAPPDAPVFGFADMHSHAFANRAFGGRLVWGDAWSDQGASDALQKCDPLHGVFGVLDPIGNFLGGHGLTHNTEGWPSFAGWPNFDSYTHQQMYYEWLKRAYDGGLRLLVVHAVNNKVLCEFGGGSPADCDDMAAVDRQIEAAKSMEAFIDGQPGGGWFKIAYSAAGARHIINGGGMAVVLGIEVDELFGCGVGSTTCSPETIAPLLDSYYDMGVRHIFPIHVFDNAFGGAAMYNELFNYGNKKVTGAFFEPWECAGAGYSFKPESNFLVGLLGTFLGLGNPIPNTIVAECNSRPLTGLGASFIRQLMRKKMIIDIDHMSATTADAALSIVEPQGYPVVAGHTGLTIVSAGQKAHEGQKTSAQIGRIAALGGLVAPILEQGERLVSGGASGIAAAPGSTVPNDCGRSSKTWAQAYLAAVALLGGPATASVGLGSDFNGLAGEPGPRFGPNACKDDPSHGPQGGGVGYPFPIFAPPGVDAGHLGQATAGARAFNYNNDGLAHVGLLPDFLQDLRSSGLTDLQLQPLFRSAEAYLQVWETIESKQVFAPTVAATLAPAAAAGGWTRDDVTVTIVATPHPQGSPNVRARYAATGATNLTETTSGGAVATLTLPAEGETTVTFSAVDDLGVRSPEQALVVRIDKSAPAVTCPAASGTWFATNVVLQCTAGDGLSGLANPADAAFDLSTGVPDGAETADATTGSRTVADIVGNVAVAGPIGGNHVDRKPPAIAISLSGDGTYLVRQAATVTYSCTDGGSGVASCDGTPASGGSLDTSTPGVKHVTVASADAVGNASSADRSYTVAYNVCPLYDPSKIKKTGSTIPVKLQVCDASAANLSRSDLLVTATSVRMVSTSTVGVLDDSGQANPDFNFRYDPSLAGYIFNLSTKGLAPGSWQLVFRIAGDPTDHLALFQLR